MAEAKWRPPSLSADSRALIGVTVFALLWRLLHLPMPRGGGDAMRKWMWARVVLAGWPPSHALWSPVRGSYTEAQLQLGWDHHAARLSINVPTTLVQAILGDHPTIYYVAPLLSSTLGLWLLFRIARRLGSVHFALWVSLGWVLLMSSAYTSQLMPEVFSPTYVLATTLCLLKAKESPRSRQRWTWLFGASACMMLAELAKIPNLFFVPGLALGCWLVMGRLRHGLAFGSLVCGWMALEWLAYRVFSDFTWGRFSVIAAGHLRAGVINRPLDGVGELLTRLVPHFSNLTGLLLTAFLPIALALTTRLKRCPPAIQLLVPAGLGFFLFHAFAIRSIDPLLPVQPPRTRYLAVLYPFIWLSLCWVVGQFVRLQRPRWLRLSPRTMHVLGAGVLLAHATTRELGRLDDHPLARLTRYKHLADNAYKEGLPFMSKSDRRHALQSYQALFWDDFDDVQCQRQKRPPLLQTYRWDGSQIWWVATPREHRLSKKATKAAFRRWSEGDVIDVAHAPGRSLRLTRKRMTKLENANRRK